MAFKFGMNFSGRPIQWNLTDNLDDSFRKEELYVPQYRPHCAECGSRLICNGCADCGKCDKTAAF